VQGILFQADYLRDPTEVNKQGYLTQSQLGRWNNEGAVSNSTFKTNFLKTKKFAMVKALQDAMVFPNEGEWWGHYADGQFSTVLTMKETNWYLQDTFGLKTADEAGRIFFETTPGNHLDFTEQQLFGKCIPPFLRGPLLFSLCLLLDFSIDIFVCSHSTHPSNALSPFRCIQLTTLLFLTQAGWTSTSTTRAQLLLHEAKLQGTIGDHRLFRYII
jgi:hypothetical protein